MCILQNPVQGFAAAFETPWDIKKQQSHGSMFGSLKESLELSCFVFGEKKRYITAMFGE